MSRRNAAQNGRPVEVAHRRAELVATAREINRRLVDLRQQRHHFRALAVAVQDAPGVKGFFVLDIPRWFTAFAAMAIRREVDGARDVRSLKLLLDKLGSEPEIAHDFTGAPISSPMLREHKRALTNVSEKITHIADKELAHATIAGPNPDMRPTFEELFACIDEFESIAARYTALITGDAMITRDDGSASPVRLAGASQARPLTQ